MVRIKIITYGIIFLSALLMSCEKEEQSQTVELSNQEKQDLMFLREEEKLARDVYLYSFDLYGISIFKNISESEQTHMDEMLRVIQYFGLEDPAHSSVGVFNDSDLQALYDQLISQSSNSLTDAYIVGVSIEERDIKDLNDSESRTEVDMIEDAYQFLECGSRNHLRQYMDKLKSTGATYTPQFISAQEFEDIVSSSNESCGGYH